MSRGLGDVYKRQFLVRQVWQSRRSIPAGPAPLSDADKARLKEIIGQRADKADMNNP